MIRSQMIRWMTRRLFLHGVACILSFCAASTARAASPEAIEAAITRGKDFLYGLQKDGHWERVPKSDFANNNEHDEGQWGGRTAMAVYTLLSLGDSPADPKLAPAIAWLKSNQSFGVYALSFRMQVWLKLPQTDEIRSLMRRDADLMMRGLRMEPGRGQGFFDYVVSDKRASGAYSLSRAQYGVLGLWAAARSGIEIPTRLWTGMETAWIAAQDPKTGGWTYRAFAEETQHPLSTGMTAAGVVSLLIVDEFTSIDSGACNGNIPRKPALDKGLAWIAANHTRDVAHAARDVPRAFPYATLYAVERVALAGGFRNFGDLDWYERGAAFIVESQSREGSWRGATAANLLGGLPDTCFSLLFLVRGRAPVAFNKLEWNPPQKQEPNWNQRPRDIANITRWIGEQSEREYRWQLVNADLTPGQLLDSPILFVSGSSELNLTDAQKSALRSYVEQGGVLIGHPDCSDRKFTADWRKLAAELFPAYEARILPATHPIYTQQQFPAARWRSRPNIESVSNGIRELMMLLPNDPARAWSRNDATGRNADNFQLAANIVQYSTSRSKFFTRGQTPIIHPLPDIKPTKTLKLARLKYGGNWNPEPAAWSRVATHLLNTRKIALDIADIDLGSDLSGLDVVHLTGTDAADFTPEHISSLKSFVEAGGLLLIDAGGGSSEFATRAEALIDAIIPRESIKPMLRDDALIGGDEANRVTLRLRDSAVAALGPDVAGRVMLSRDGEKIRVAYSRLDLVSGLVGHQFDGIVGWDPESALQLVTQILSTR